MYRIGHFCSATVFGFKRCYRNTAVIAWAAVVYHALCGIAHGAALPTERDDFRLIGVVNLNLASIEELSLLPSIGPTRAARIVRYRQKRPFKRTVELARVRGIGLKTFRRLKGYLAVQGQTTLRRSKPAVVP